MKRITILSLLACTLFLFSCKKNHDSAKSRTQLLTAKTWILDEFYTGYNTTTPILAYKKGRPNNAYDATNYYIKFNADGTYSRRENNGTMYTGVWVWLSNESAIQTTEALGTNSSTTVELTANSYIWNATSNGTYGKMIPQ